MTQRWRLHRAGIQNVWHYWETEFVLTGGRMVLRGTNGSGKSRALELLLPFLLDADRRRMDSSGSGQVSLDRLMRVGGPEGGNRVGYLWLELAHSDGSAEPTRFLTLGAHLRWSASAGTVKVHWFTTERRVGHDLSLLDANRHALPREDLGRLIGPDQVTDSPDAHRARVREQVFGLTDARAEERFDGLTQLLHTLRSPDVGNRIDEGRLPALLSDALPPLSQATLDAAGAKLDEISETRALQDRLERSVADLDRFLGAYRRYAQGELATATARARTATRDRARAERVARTAEQTRADAEAAAASAESSLSQAQEHHIEVQATLRGLTESAEHRDLLERSHTVTSLRRTAELAAKAADAARVGEADRAAAAVGEVREAAEAAARTSAQFTALAEQCAAAGLPDPLPPGLSFRVVDLPGAADAVRARVDADPEPLRRPAGAELDLADVDVAGLQAAAGTVRRAAGDREQLLGARVADSRRLVRQLGEVGEAERRRDEAQARVAEATARADLARDAVRTAVSDLRARWRAWVQAPETAQRLGAVDWTATAVGRWLAQDDDVDGTLDQLDQAAAAAARSATERLFGERAELGQQRGALERRRADLTARRADLLAERDPDPDRPGWTGESTGTPLWRAVDFAEGADPDEQAGVEAALIGSGLLTAVLTSNGATGAATGDLLVDAAGPPVTRPLAGVLVPDPGSGVPVEQVAAVLARIGWRDRSGSCWLDGDGSFRLGADRPARGAARPVHRCHRPGPAPCRAAGRAGRGAAGACRGRRRDRRATHRAGRRPCRTRQVRGHRTPQRCGPRRRRRPAQRRAGDRPRDGRRRAPGPDGARTARRLDR